jgi:hypothetical protein
MIDTLILKLSLLNLVLISASAVATAILPKANTKLFAAGHLFAHSTGGSGSALFTCKQAGSQAVNCDFTATQGEESSTTYAIGTSPDGITTGEANTGLIIRFGIANSS